MHLQDDGGLEDYGLGNLLPVPPDDTSADVQFTVVVSAVADPPVAGDDAATVAEDSGGTVILVRANDSDADGDAIQVTAVGSAAKGTVVISGIGTSVSYTPDPDANGSDSFGYTLSDGNGGTDTATVAVTITPVNDDPTAAGDAKTLLEDAAATAIDVRANDSIAPDTGETLSISSTTTASKGTVAITGGGTGLTYTPNLNQNGAESFTYTVIDGNGGTDSATVDVTITAVNDAPTAATDSATVIEDQASASSIAVLANDTDVESNPRTVTGATSGAKGTTTFSTTGVTYKPNANAFGSDSFSYTVSDGQGGSATGTVNVTITPVNDNPNAVNDGSSVRFVAWVGGGPSVLPVLANDTSAPDSAETLTITGITPGTLGTVAITGNGTGLTYTASGSATGIDVFTYTINDGNGGTDQATVQVFIGSAQIDRIWFTRLPRQPVSRVAVAWTITTGAAGIAAQTLQRRVDGGAWTSVPLASVSTRVAAMGAGPGHTYAFRVQAVALSSAVSPWATSANAPS